MGGRHNHSLAPRGLEVVYGIHHSGVAEVQSSTKQGLSRKVPSENETTFNMIMDSQTEESTLGENYKRPCFHG